MSDAPEVYQAVPQGSPSAGHSGPYFSGPRPESEGLQVHSAYVENYNKAPYSDNPALGPQQYGSPPLGQQQQQYVNAPLGHQPQYVENQPGGFLQAPPYAPQPDEKGRKKRICGLSVLVFWCLIIAAFLIVVGAVVGGVVGSAKSKDSKSSGSAAGSDTSGGSLSSSIDVTPTTTAPSTTTSTTTTSASASATAAFAEDTFYRLSNQFLKAAYSLTIDKNNGTLSRKLNMSITADDDTAQFWQIKKVPDADERYWFASRYLGKSIRLYLDPSDRINPLMEDADDTSTGQQWYVKSVLDGTWRISNALGNTGAQLSTYSDTHGLFMDMDDDTGTEWSIAEVRKIVAADDFS
ncbi:hypothetical protein V502_09229 [Pseudogymnoascus sp. VKM F-4520 (FW-2644)]|nr:hypothetical protein V502_09229 [Pseudogymnoascus sp. VKM F-4520 (FW-2644)]